MPHTLVALTERNVLAAATAAAKISRKEMNKIQQNLDQFQVVQCSTYTLHRVRVLRL